MFHTFLHALLLHISVYALHILSLGTAIENRISVVIMIVLVSSSSLRYSGTLILSEKADVLFVVI